MDDGPPPMDDVVEESLQDDPAPAASPQQGHDDLQAVDEDVPLHEPQTNLAAHAEVSLTSTPSRAAAATSASAARSDPFDFSSSTISPAPAAAAAAPAFVAAAASAPSARAESSEPSSPSPAPAPAPAAKLVLAAAAVPAVAAATPAAAAAAAAAASSSAAAVAVDDSQMQISVTNPERIGDGMSSYIAYTVTTKTSLPSFRQPETTVKRRYNDFFTLYKHLEDEHPGVIVPLPPPKDAIGTGLSKFKSNSESSFFIERRTQALSRFMQRIASHLVLHGDPVVRSFLESTDKIPKPSTSMFAGLSSKLGTFVETDEWFNEKVNEIDTLESQLKKVHGVQEGLVNRRKELSTAGLALVEALATLAGVEDQQTVSKALHALSDVQARVAKLQLEQAESEFFDFSEIISDYLSLVSAIKTCFGQRQTAYKEWQSAEATLMKKRENEAKMKAQGKFEKGEQAARDVLEAETTVQTTKKSMEDLTERLRAELGRFDATKVKEFRKMILGQVEALMTMEHQILKAWEQFLPEAKNIAA